MALTTEDIDHLKDLKEKTDEFTSLVFDWVSPLHHQHLLGELYDFKRRIDEALQTLEAQSNDNGD